MTKQGATTILTIMMVMFIIVGTIFVGIGFYKHIKYENPSGDSYRYYYEDESVNAYVGGDAYNYIINGTYFTAYSVLGVGSFIIAAITGVGALFMSVNDNVNIKTENKQISILEDIESNLPRM